MAEPIPQQPEIPQGGSIIVGETPIFLTTPTKMGGREITSFVIKSSKDRGPAGISSSVVLMREPNRKKGEEGTLIDKPMIHTDPRQEIPWEKVSGIQWTDETGTVHKIGKEELSLNPPESSSSFEVPDLGDQNAVNDQPEPFEKPPQSRARELLSTLTEDPNTITIVGLRAYETRALDLADRAMQKLGGPRMQERAKITSSLFDKTKEAVQNIEHFTKNVMWKQSIGGIYFHERARQYYMDMLKAAETPFAEAAIRLAEKRANERYQARLSESNFIARIGTKAVDVLRDTLGMRTTIQNMALEEIAIMKANGQIEGTDIFEREATAIRARFSQDMEKATQFVRQQMGEKLEILDPAKEEHKPLVEGIQNLLTRYATGEITDKAEFDLRTKEFFDRTLKDARPDVFAEAELYSSSLFETAEMLRSKASHEAGLANLDEAMAGMQIRLGLGAMGEVTSLEPTAVERGIGKVREVVEWLNKHHVIVPMVFNEASIGTGVALALSAANFVKTMPARIAVGIGGGALAGGLFAGWREYGQLNREFMTHMREKETGAKFTETQKRRSWFERFAVTQRSAEDIMATMQTAMETGDYRAAMATIADLQARKAVSEVGPKRIGLIQYSGRDTIESERSALDLLASKTLSDLSAASDLNDLLGGNTLEDYMVKLTTLQTRVLREGVGVLESAEDPVMATLDVVSPYAPEIAMIKRRWPFVGRTLSETTDSKVEGLDAILEEFKKEARLEAIKYGAKAGVIGAGVGTAFHLVADMFANTATIGESVESATKTVKDAVIDRTQPPVFAEHGAHTTGDIALSAPSADNMVLIGNHEFQLPPELTIDPVTSPGGGTTTYNAVLHLTNGPAKEIVLGNGVSEHTLLDTLKDAGFSVEQGHDAITDASKAIDIPGITSPYGDRLSAQIPPDYQLQKAGDAWNLLNDKHDVVASGLQFKNDGSLVNADAIRNQLADHGLTLDTSKTVELVGKHTVEMPVAETLPFPKPNMTLNSEQMAGGNVWDYFLGKSHGENSVSAANGMKNLFRMYTTENTDAVSFPEGSPHEGYIQEHLRDAVYGSNTVKEIDLARIPNDAQFRLPEQIFGQGGIDRFNDLNDAAITHLNELIKAGSADGATIRGPGDAINYLYNSTNSEDKLHGIVLKLGYLGQDDKLPSDPKDLELIMKELGATVKTEAPAPTDAFREVSHRFTAHNTIIKEIPAPATPGSISGETLNLSYSLPSEIPDTAVSWPSEAARAAEARDIPMGDTQTEWPSEAARAAHYGAIHEAADLTEQASKLPWIPIFIPYHQALERVMGPGEIMTAIRPTEMLLSPFFGGEELYLTRDVQNERKSPRLSENPRAVLSQKEEIDWYLSTLSESENERIEQLINQVESPMSPDTRAVVLMPSLSTTVPIYDRLIKYATQRDGEGNTLSPKTAEFVIYDIKLPGVPESTVKADIERFSAEHPDIPVVYMQHAYDQIQGTGEIKRDLTNAVLSRIAKRPIESAHDVTIITDNGGNTIPETYLADALGALDAEPAIDMVTGDTRLDPVVYQQFPMAFAQHRALELMDAMVRQGESGGIPAIGSGNMAIRSSTLAGVGGYNTTAPFAEDRELAWIVKNARNSTDTIRQMPELQATVDPTESAYRLLQRVELADASIPHEQHETYKDMSFQDMASQASDKYTQEMIEEDMNNLYHSLYPSLKASDPKRFDAYISKTLDALGVQHEIINDTIKIISTESLAANMAADIDLESFAKDKAMEAIRETPHEAETSRDTLTSLAGEEAGSEPVKQPREEVSSSISSPDITTEESHETESMHAEIPAKKPDLIAEAETKTEGIEDRINYVLERIKDNEVSVGVTPGELMDYLKTRLELAAGTRITDGNIQITDNTVVLKNMQAKSPVGTAHFEATMVSDPTKGLMVDMNSVHYKLPMLMRILEGRIKNSLTHFDQELLHHMGQRIPKEWKATRSDIVGEKIAIKFSKSS